MTSESKLRNISRTHPSRLPSPVGGSHHERVLSVDADDGLDDLAQQLHRDDAHVDGGAAALSVLPPQHVQHVRQDLYTELQLRDGAESEVPPRAVQSYSWK